MVVPNRSTFVPFEAIVFVPPVAVSSTRLTRNRFPVAARLRLFVEVYDVPVPANVRTRFGVTVPTGERESLPSRFRHRELVVLLVLSAQLPVAVVPFHTYWFQPTSIRMARSMLVYARRAVPA